MNQSDLKGVALATSAYLFLYYIFIINQSRTRFAVKKKIAKADKAENKPKPKNSLSLAFMRNDPRVVNHPQVIAADRAVLNTLEQMPPFLVAIWLLAVLVDAQQAALLAWIYVVTRALYPLLYHNFKLLVSLSTGPGYLVIFFALGRVAIAALA